MTEAERALLLKMSEYLGTILHNARWPDAGEQLRVLRAAVTQEEKVDGEATQMAPAAAPVHRQPEDNQP